MSPLPIFLLLNVGDNDDDSTMHMDKCQLNETNMCLSSNVDLIELSLWMAVCCIPIDIVELKWFVLHWYQSIADWPISMKWLPGDSIEMISAAISVFSRRTMMMGFCVVDWNERKSYRIRKLMPEHAVLNKWIKLRVIMNIRYLRYLNFWRYCRRGCDVRGNNETVLRMAIA